jgi:hypothetical protein
MALTWKKPWNRGGDAPRVDCECVCACLLNIPRYIFIVRRLSILSKLDCNNPYRIWAEIYFPNLNYLIILDTWPIWPSWRPRRSRFISGSYLSFGPILFMAHLLVWPCYGDNSHIIPSYHIISDYALFWTYWRYAWILVHMRLFVIWCSWNGRSTKVISNKNLSSISCMKYNYVGGKSMHFMTTNIRHPSRRPPSSHPPAL